MAKEVEEVEVGAALSEKGGLDSKGCVWSVELNTSKLGRLDVASKLSGGIQAALRVLAEAEACLGAKTNPVSVAIVDATGNEASDALWLLPSSWTPPVKVVPMPPLPSPTWVVTPSWGTICPLASTAAPRLGLKERSQFWPKRQLPAAIAPTAPRPRPAPVFARPWLELALTAGMNGPKPPKTCCC